MGNKKYYVYEFVRLDYNEPFYIGKGCGERWRCLYRKGNDYFNNICKTIPVAVVILHDSLDEQTALEYECWYIWYYRDVLGYSLVNMTDGGEGGNTWANLSANKRKERSIKVSMANIERWKKISDNERKKFGQKISETLIERGSLRGEKNPMFGKKQTEKCKLAVSKAHKGKKLPKHQIEKIIERNLKNNPMKGKTLKDFMSEDEYEKYLNNLRKACSSNEFREKQSKIAKERFKNKENHPMFGKTDIYGKKVEMLDEHNNVIKQFNSILSAARFLNVKGCTGLRKALKNNSLYHGYYWRYS